MDKRTFMKKFAIWTAVVVAIVMLVLGLCFGKVIEETLFGEIAKWVVMTIVIIGTSRSSHTCWGSWPMTFG